jgi:NADPH-dependent curcumin reductase CurA
MTVTTDQRSGVQVAALRNRAIRLVRRPVGAPAAEDFEFVDEQVPEPGPGQALIRTCYLSVDPTTRVWLSDGPGYMPPIPVGEVVRSLGTGQVITSRRGDLPEGALAFGFTGWQEYCVTDESTLIPPAFPFFALPRPLAAPLPAYLGVLGHTGLTAYVLADMGRPRAGETVVVSAAAGAVGSIVGQLAKIRGARVVGVAGGPERCAHVVSDLGFDDCVDRQAGDWPDRLDAATPDGIDVDFENVGSEIMDRVLTRLNLGARVILSGMISTYNDGGPGARGQRELMELVYKRASIQGMLVFDHLGRAAEAATHLAGLLAVGALRYDETILEGLERAPEAMTRILDGTKVGKMLVHVSDPVTG